MSLRPFALSLVAVGVAVLSGCGDAGSSSRPEDVESAVDAPLAPSIDGEESADAPDASQSSASQPATSREDAEPAAVDTSKPDEAPVDIETAAQETVDPKWKRYFDALPFVMGPEKGLAKAKELNRPALFFYAATW